MVLVPESGKQAPADEDQLTYCTVAERAHLLKRPKCGSRAPHLSLCTLVFTKAAMGSYQIPQILTTLLRNPSLFPARCHHSHALSPTGHPFAVGSISRSHPLGISEGRP